MEVFCDEVRLPHPGAAADARLRALFGRHRFEDGSFRPELRKRLAESSTVDEPAIKALHGLFVMILARWALSGRLSYSLPSTNLVDDTLFFDGNEHSHRLPQSPRPRTVVDYGPGIGQRFILQEHFRAVATGRPFFYLPVTKGPFVNHFALQCLELVQGPEEVARYLAGHFYLPRGRHPGRNNKDVCLFASRTVRCGHLLGFADDRQEGARGGHRESSSLLRPGGVLQIRAVNERNPPEAATADDMLAIAYRAGFSDPLLFHPSPRSDPASALRHSRRF